MKNIRLTIVGVAVIASLWFYFSAFRPVFSERKADEAINDAGFVVSYYFQHDPYLNHEESIDESRPLPFFPNAQCPGPKSLQAVFGAHMFTHVYEVYCNFGGNNPRVVGARVINDDDLRQIIPILCAFQKLEVVDISYTDVSDEGLIALTKIAHLRFVIAQETKITSEGVTKLSKLSPGITVITNR